jgi:hypothetical protein
LRGSLELPYYVIVAAAGIIWVVGNNGVGVSGISRNDKIMPLKILDRVYTLINGQQMGIRR